MSGIARIHATLPLMVLTMRVHMNRPRAFWLVAAMLWAGCSAPIRPTDPGPGPIPAPFTPPAATAASAIAPAGAPSAPAVRPEPEPGGADLDPTNDGVVAPPDPIADCGALLRQAGVQAVTSALPVHRESNGRITCGAEQVVVYQVGPQAIRYNIAPTVTCGLALAIARLEVVVQEEARARFGKRVVRIDHGGTYTCRRMARFRHMVSEHSYANAIDVRSFTLEDGRRISVLAHFGSTASEPAAPEGQFLRTVARRLYDEAVFSVVLTRFWDEGHRDHFHLDMARYRVDGTR
jgi:hypothetical protein